MNTAKLVMDRAAPLTLTGVERSFGPDDIIVTKTDLKGHITYANRLFCTLAGYTEEQVLGAPHCIIRHPHMPRCVFKLLWDTIQQGQEIFAYVVNRSANGDHYWVFAHVTPCYGSGGKVEGYHSNRRVADRTVVTRTIMPLYETLRTVENQHDNPKDAAAAGVAALVDILNKKNLRYDEFVFSLQHTA